jgi:hypothetical protein
MADLNDKPAIEAAAKQIAAKVAKNAGVAPQLCYAPVFFGLCDLLPTLAAATPSPQAAPSGLTDARILEIAAEQDYGDEDPKCITRLARAFEKEIAAAPASLTPAPQGTASAKQKVRDLLAANAIHMGDAFIDKLLSAASLTQAATSEPVAWAICDDDGKPFHMTAFSNEAAMHAARGKIVKPMTYAAPAAAHPAPSDEHAAELDAIGKRIGYGRACQILGELWDQMLEREYGRPSSRGKMERRRDIEEIEALLKSRAALSAQQAGGQEAPQSLREAVYMALHYYMKVQSPNEWEAADAAIAAVRKFDAALSASSAVTNEDAKDEKDALNDAIQRAAGELPPGHMIRVEVEHGAGWVEWEDDEGYCQHIESDEGSLAERVIEAIERAALASQGVKGGE